MNIFSFVALALLQTSSVPTIDQIRTAFQAKQYPEVTKMVAQAMPAAIKAGGTDRAELLEMKGESALQLKQFSLATDAFKQAGAASTDEKLAAIDHATGTLIQSSTSGKYVPKLPSTNPATPGRQPPIDIIDPTERKQAFAALYADKSKQLTTQTAALARANNPQAMLNGMKQISESRYLEVAATGSDTQYQAAISGITDHAGDLMGQAVKTMSTSVDAIVKKANQSTIQTVPGQHLTGAVMVDTKQGLNSTDKNDLTQVIDNATFIGQACEAFGKAAGKASSIEAVKTDATALAKKAKDALDADYNSSTSSLANPPVTVQNPGAVVRPPTK